MDASLSGPSSSPLPYRHVRLREHIDRGNVRFRMIYRSTMFIIGVDTNAFDTEVNETDEATALNNLGTVFKGLAEAKQDKNKLLLHF